jgi:Family of unknown function (DUF5519)
LLGEKDVRYLDLGAGDSRELQEEIRGFIKSLHDVERKPDSMSEEDYFYGNRNFPHFHGARHIDIGLPNSKQEEASWRAQSN